MNKVYIAPTITILGAQQKNHLIYVLNTMRPDNYIRTRNNLEEADYTN